MCNQDLLNFARSFPVRWVNVKSLLICVGCILLFYIISWRITSICTTLSDVALWKCKEHLVCSSSYHSTRRNKLKPNKTDCCSADRLPLEFFWRTTEPESCQDSVYSKPAPGRHLLVLFPMLFCLLSWNRSQRHKITSLAQYIIITFIASYFSGPGITVGTACACVSAWVSGQWLLN